ncbi:MAG: segregation/condensation protein A [Fibrobacteria bacterium]|nr:segregation/condensation protein A [Fibrobacteria bacterium]
MHEEARYEVKLKVFEGPLDLLVYLVQKSELDPREIPIAVITDQYLDYMKNIGVHNLSQAGEFLVMASRLMCLKARELLPDEEKDEIEEMEFDLDKEALIQQMMEYQKFKEASKFFKHLEVKNYGVFPRGKKERLPKEKPVSDQEQSEAGIYELLSAFSNSIKTSYQPRTHDIEIDDVTIENQIKKIQDFLISNPRCLFEDVYQDDSRRIVIVVMFMSLLELCKLDEVHVRQHRNLSPIWVYRKQNYPEHLPQPPENKMDIDPLAEFKPGLVQHIQNSIILKKDESNLDKVLKELQMIYTGETIIEPSDADTSESVEN